MLGDHRVTLSLKPLRRQQQPTVPRPQNRIGIPPATLPRWRRASRDQPSRPCTRATIRSESNSYARLRISSRLVGRPLVLKLRGALLLTSRPLPAHATEELGPPFPGAQLPGQLIPARLPELLILGVVDRSRVREDLPGDRGEVKND